VRLLRGNDDLVVMSLHWGSNWVDAVPEAHRAFARTLIDSAAIDVVHGHSSHHPLAIEVYRERPILYGCGDFLNDYEGIGGYQRYRPDLVLGYLVDCEARTGALRQLVLMPFRLRRFRLNLPEEADLAWIATRMDQLCAEFGVTIRRRGTVLMAQWSA
jgi:poly-gamma-glutamate capsule biosynthesis protein CapA/YwtB (metallophosphatase superfamily)